MTDTSLAPAQEGTVPPTEGATPEPVTTDATPQTGTAADASTGERPHRAEGRIKELVTERDAALEYGEFWRKRFEESHTQQAQPAAKPAEEPRPKRADFDDDDAWADALTGWQDRRTTAKAEEAAAARLERDREAARLEGLQTSFNTRVQQFEQTHPDFRVAISNPALKFFDGEFLNALMENEKGPELAYHIAKSPELAARLMRQSPSQRLTTLGRIEGEISRPPPAPKASSAPPPLTPITSASSGGAVDMEKLSATDYLRVRLQQRAAREKRT